MLFFEIYGTGAKDSEREKRQEVTLQRVARCQGTLVPKVVDGWKPQKAMKTLQNIRMYTHSNRPKD